MAYLLRRARATSRTAPAADGSSHIGLSSLSTDLAVLLATQTKDDDDGSTRAGTRSATVRRNARRDRADETRVALASKDEEIDRLKAELAQSVECISRLTRQRDLARLRAAIVRSRDAQLRRESGMDSDMDPEAASESASSVNTSSVSIGNEEEEGDSDVVEDVADDSGNSAFTDHPDDDDLSKDAAQFFANEFRALEALASMPRLRSVLPHHEVHHLRNLVDRARDAALHVSDDEACWKWGGMMQRAIKTTVESNLQGLRGNLLAHESDLVDGVEVNRFTNPAFLALPWEFRVRLQSQPASETGTPIL